MNPTEEFEKFKEKISPDIQEGKVDIDFEIGYCIGERRQCWGEPLEDYYTLCIAFLQTQQIEHQPHRTWRR